MKSRGKSWQTHTCITLANTQCFQRMIDAVTLEEARRSGTSRRILCSGTEVRSLFPTPAKQDSSVEYLAEAEQRRQSRRRKRQRRGHSVHHQRPTTSPNDIPEAWCSRSQMSHSQATTKLIRNERKRIHKLGAMYNESNARQTVLRHKHLRYM